jgi:hypothetical protein
MVCVDQSIVAGRLRRKANKNGNGEIGMEERLARNMKIEVKGVTGRVLIQNREATTRMTPRRSAEHRAQTCNV